jgi:hypothetical protein
MHMYCTKALFFTENRYYKNEASRAFYRMLFMISSGLIQIETIGAGKVFI